MEREGERHLAALAFFLDRGIELAEQAHLAFGAEPDDVAGSQPLAGFDEGAPARAVEALMQGRLDRGLGIAAPDPPPAQSRRNDLAVIDHEGIAGPQQPRQIAHAVVIEYGRRTGPHHQEPRGVARRSSDAKRSARPAARNRTDQCASQNPGFALTAATRGSHKPIGPATRPRLNRLPLRAARYARGG